MEKNERKIKQVIFRISLSRINSEQNYFFLNQKEALIKKLIFDSKPKLFLFLLYAKNAYSHRKIFPNAQRNLQQTPKM